MYTPKPISPREGGNVVILGAGASYGSSLNKKPPLINNFISESKKYGIYDKYLSLWKFLDSIGYSEKDLLSGNHNIEKIFSIIDIISTGLWYKDSIEYYNEIGTYLKIIPNDLLRSFIVEVIYKSSINALKHTCVHHSKIFEELKRGDTVISFNYDLIAESSLSRLGKWSEFNGYGFYCPEVLEKNYSAEKIINNILYDIEKYWDNDNYKFEENLSEIILLKPHGSINWLLNNGSRVKDNIGFDSHAFHENLFGVKKMEGSSRIDLITLKNILNDDREIIGWLPIHNIELFNESLEKVSKTNPDKRWLLAAKIKSLSYKRYLFGPYIIAPSIFKFNTPQPYELIQIWSMLKEALTKARHILCIGYAFGDADLQFNTIFNLAVNNNKNSKIDIGIVDLNKNDIVKKLGNSLNKISIKIEPICNKLDEVNVDNTITKKYFK
jgi:hypothetical protein